MDELIRELREAQAEVERRSVLQKDTPAGLVTAGMAAGLALAITKALEAKRRMAEREPAWDLQP